MLNVSQPAGCDLQHDSIKSGAGLWNDRERGRGLWNDSNRESPPPYPSPIKGGGNKKGKCSAEGEGIKESVPSRGRKYRRKIIFS